MSKLIRHGDDDNTDLVTMTQEELAVEFASALTVSKRGLLRAASIWRIFEDKGYDLSSLRSGIAGVIPQIANGTLTPEAVVKFLGMATHLNALRQLLPALQIELVNGKLLEIADPFDAAKIETKPLEKMTAAEVKRVIIGGVIATPTQQHIADQQRKAIGYTTAKPKPKIKVDRERGEVKPPPFDIPTETVKLPALVTPEQAAHAYEAAKRSGERLEMLIWNALRHAGLI